METQIKKIIRSNKSSLPVCSNYWEISNTKYIKKPIYVHVSKYMTSEYSLKYSYKPISVIIDLSKYEK